MHGAAAIAVLGAGSWGTALAVLLSRNRHDVRLWGNEPTQIADLAVRRENTVFLPGIALPAGLRPLADLAEAIRGATEVLIVVPSHAFGSVVRQFAAQLDPGTRVSWATKGFEPGSRRLLHEVAEEFLGERSLAVISGPTFAQEVARGLPTAITVASRSAEHARQLAGYLHAESFRAYTTDDIVGVEVGGAAKNVLAIAAGIADGLGFGANTRAALITRGLAEITRLGIAMGGKAETFMGLAGLGDLALTCTDDQSRNRRMGMALARGQTVEEARRTIGQEVEGVQTAQEVWLKAQALGIEMPITEQTYRVLYRGLSPREAVQALLERRQKSEWE
jgi:glycerol-3-phosphate dehydrogenase (NAD(P)+)